LFTNFGVFQQTKRSKNQIIVRTYQFAGLMRTSYVLKVNESFSGLRQSAPLQTGPGEREYKTRRRLKCKEVFFEISANKPKRLIECINSFGIENKLIRICSTVNRTNFTVCLIRRQAIDILLTM
jgi:hypothetical protein